MIDQDEELFSLIDRCITGDKRAWESFWKEYGKIVTGYLSRLSYFREKKEEMGDVAQQVFLKLWYGGLKNCNRASRYQFLKYLKTITKNEVYTFLSKIKREPMVSLDQGTRQDDEAHPINVPSGASGPEEVVRATELAGLLEKHWQTYPLLDQEIFLMVNDGKTYKVVAEVMGMPLSTVAFRYSRVREGLLKIMKGN